MKIEARKLESIRPYENNPRLNEGAVEAVVASIREFGFRQPIVIDEHGVIIAGHTRYKAAQQLGLKKIPVHVARDLPPEKVKAYRIADNRSGEIAEWDYDLLPIELSELQEMDYDLSLLGFDEDSIAKMLGNELAEGLTDPDDVPDAPEEAITQPGDLWLLGDPRNGHRLLCGDSTKPEDVQLAMDGIRADLMLTDPPYNVDYTGKTKDAMKVANDSMRDADFRAFLIASIGNGFDVMKPGAAFYIWHADSEGYNFRGAVVDCQQKVRQCLVWAKQTMVMGRQDYQWQHEPCLYGWKDGASHGWYSDRKQTTVLNFDRPSRSEQHPTMKPVAMFAYLMGNSTAPQGVVYDPFLGSGTSVIAAEQLGRRCVGLELDPVYCDVIVKRWEEFTGRKAKRVSPREKASASGGAEAGKVKDS